MLNGNRNTKREEAIGKSETANGKRQKANGKRQTANDKRHTANGKRQTAKGKRQTANDKRQTANGKRQTAHELVDGWKSAGRRAKHDGRLGKQAGDVQNQAMTAERAAAVQSAPMPSAGGSSFSCHPRFFGRAPSRPLPGLSSLPRCIAARNIHRI